MCVHHWLAIDDDLYMKIFSQCYIHYRMISTGRLFLQIYHILKPIWNVLCAYLHTKGQQIWTKLVWDCLKFGRGTIRMNYVFERKYLYGLCWKPAWIGQKRYEIVRKKKCQKVPLIPNEMKAEKLNPNPPFC